MKGAPRPGPFGPCLLLAACLGAPALGAGEAPPPRPARGAHYAKVASEATVREELQAMCRSMRDGDNGFYGQRPMKQLEERLRHPVADAAESAQLHAELGREYLEQGRPEDSVAALTEAVRLARQAKVDRDLLIGIESYLGLAHLRAGETANCVLHHTRASCILPISKEGRHILPNHARQAAEVFLDVLKIDPRNVQMAWLLNIARMTTGDWPEGVPEEFRLPSSALASEAPFPRWHDRAGDLGIDVVDLAGGAVMEDLDGDGLLDLVSSTWDPCGSMKAFRNDGRGGFEDVTEKWGLADQLGGLNLVQADYDNDGHPDLLVLRGAWLFHDGWMRNSLLHNELAGPRHRFVDVTLPAGLAGDAYPTQAAAWGDYDGDGDLDLYVGNEARPEDPYPSQLYRNNGDGTFTDVATAAGVTNLRYAKAVAWGDYDDDGDPDLYVSNVGPNRLYRNDGDGTFTDVAPSLGVTAPEGRSFGTWFFDYDNDGDLDLFVVDYTGPNPRVVASYFGVPFDHGQSLLYRNDGGRFTEVSRQVGLTRPLLPMGVNYGDLDNDGFLDVYLGTGEPGYQVLNPNVMYRNDGGRRFEDITSAGGFGHLQKGHGIAFGDLDNDGDQDLFHQLGGFYPGDAFANALFENPGNSNAWITLRLEGVRANRFGQGARIEVRVREAPAPGAPEGVGSERSIYALAGTGASFGGSSLQQEIGLGSATRIEEIVIRWPGSGTVDRYRDVALDRTYRAVEGAKELQPVVVPRLVLGGRGPRPHAHPSP